jgi:two-component system nitrate/nitrite response regulator NarL
MTVSIVRADGHPVYSDGLPQAIAARGDLEIVGTAGDGRQAIALIREHRPDVAVLEMRMPGLSGLEVAARVAREMLPTRTLLLTAAGAPGVMVDAVSQGVDGYLLKDATGTTICDAIASVAEGRIVLPRRDRRVRDEVLSGRERRVLQLTADGLSSVLVGEALHLSRASVKAHLRGIYRKLGVSERAAAVAVGMRSGLLE